MLFVISDCLPAIPGQCSMPHFKDYVYSSRCPGLHSELTLTPRFLLESRCNGPLSNSIPDLWNQNRRVILHRLIVFVLFVEVIEAWWRMYAVVNLVITGSDNGLSSQIAKFMGPTWHPPGSCWPQMGPMLAPWTLLSEVCYGVKPLPEPLLTCSQLQPTKQVSVIFELTHKICFETIVCKLSAIWNRLSLIFCNVPEADGGGGYRLWFKYFILKNEYCNFSTYTS